MSVTLDDVRAAVRDVLDFPQPGIVFKDITPVLAQPQLMRCVIQEMAARFAGQQVDQVVGIDARGFIFAAMLAYEWGAGFVPLRKPGKLPWRTQGVDYDLEYGSSRIEMHEDALMPGQRVVLADDLLATGGTSEAALQLIQQSGAQLLGSVFMIELGFLPGRAKIAHTGPVHSLLKY
jgi:adenine phosphoribosyltransferase